MPIHVDTGIMCIDVRPSPTAVICLIICNIVHPGGKRHFASCCGDANAVFPLKIRFHEKCYVDVGVRYYPSVQV